MIANKNNVSLGFTDEKFPQGQHILLVFNDDRRRRRTIAKYIESGILEGEKVACLLDSITPQEILTHLDDMGLDVDIHKKDLTIKGAKTTYCPDGRFSIQHMLDTIANAYQQAIADGYTGLRTTGETNWILQEHVSIQDILEYEVRLTRLLKKYPATACCQYDARYFDSDTIMDILNVHPTMIVDDQLVKNPQYLDLNTYLKNFKKPKNAS